MATLFAGLDVSDRETALCVLRAGGETVLEVSLPTEPGAILQALKPYRRLLKHVGHESGAKATWLHKELARKKLPVICLDARHTHAALSANRNKTDRNDARGIAQVLARGIFMPAYVRSDASQRLRDLLNHRQALLRKANDLRLLVKATVKLAGLEIIPVRDGASRLRAPPRRGVDPHLACAVDCTQRAIVALDKEADTLSRLVEKLAREDPVCRRLMTMPGVGPLTALCFRAAVDEPSRFHSSRNLAAYFGLTPRTFQSGASCIVGRISKRGDGAVRELLYQAATSVLVHCKGPSRLRTWSLQLREAKGFKVAAIACARRIAVVLHRMWVTERDFDPAL